MEKDYGMCDKTIKITEVELTAFKQYMAYIKATNPLSFKLFINFLKHHKIFYIFIKELYRGIHPVYIMDYHGIIGNAFGWTGTLNGWGFWYSINKKWQDIIVDKRVVLNNFRKTILE